MTQVQPLVVTGLGVVDAGAWGMEAAAASFAAPDPRPVEVDRSAGYHRGSRSHCALLVDRAPRRNWLSPMAARRMSPASQYAVCAAKMAVEEAGLEPGNMEGRTAVVLASTYGAVDTTEGILRQIFLDGPETISPALFTESVANAPAAQIAIALGARALNLTVTQRQASVAIALSRAKFELAADRADRVLVGTVDEITPILHAILDRFKALAVPEDDGVERARPFDRRRSGWLAAEGAVVAVLEREIDARQRGARVLARLLGAGSAFDPEAPRTGWGKSPRILADSLRAYLAREECETGMVNRVVTAAGGHPAADRLEGQLIREVWGESEVPPVLAPAAVSGAYGGSLLSAAILAAGNRAFGPTPGFGELDPDAGVIPHDGKELPPASHILATACAAGGAAGWALFESP